MNKYDIKMMVTFQGEIEAESEADAEQKAWELWGTESDAEISYDGVYSIDVKDLGEICEDCEEAENNCFCEEEEEEEDEDDSEEEEEEEEEEE